MSKREIIKELNKLAPINSPELYRQVADLLKKGVDFTPEKKEEYAEDGTFDFLYKLIGIHRAFFEIDPFGDMFGEYLTENELLSDRAGQFFTPMPVAQMMVDMLNPLNDIDIDTEKFQSILDPASGSGRFMLRTAKYYYTKKKPFNFVFTNIDIDLRMWTFTTMNAVLHDIPSINIHGDTLALKYWGAYSVVPTNGGIGLWYKLDPEMVREEHMAILESNRKPQGMEQFVGKLKKRVRDEPVRFTKIKPKQKKLLE